MRNWLQEANEGHSYLAHILQASDLCLPGHSLVLMCFQNLALASRDKTLMPGKCGKLPAGLFFFRGDRKSVV